MRFFDLHFMSFSQKKRLKNIIQCIITMSNINEDIKNLGIETERNCNNCIAVVVLVLIVLIYIDIEHNTKDFLEIKTFLLRHNSTRI